MINETWVKKRKVTTFAIIEVIYNIQKKEKK